MTRLLTMTLMFILSLPAQAAWITYRNDTNQAVIVQDVVTVRGKGVPGRPVKLTPGQTHREFHPGNGTKSVQILEPGYPANKLLCETDIAVKDKDLSLSIALVKGQIKLQPAEPAKK